MPHGPRIRRLAADSAPRHPRAGQLELSIVPRGYLPPRPSALHHVPREQCGRVGLPLPPLPTTIEREILSQTDAPLSSGLESERMHGRKDSLELDVVLRTGSRIGNWMRQR